MKNWNRLYHLLSVAIGIFVLCALPKAALAQDRDVIIDVSAEVTSSIELITLQSMELAAEEAENNIINIDPTSSPNAGKMVALGNPNSEIRVSYLQTRELASAENSETLTFNYLVSGNQEEDQNTSELLDLENRDFSFNQDGEFYLWIGGSVDISTASPGNYQGEFTLEIEYI